MNRERKGLLKNINAIAGALSLAVITIYVADLGLQPSRLFKPEVPRTDNQAETKTADRIGTDLIVERFDDQGNISHRFSSRQAEYFKQPNPQSKDNGSHDTDISAEDSFNEGELFFNEDPTPYNVVIKASEPVIRVFDAGKAIAELDANTAITDGSNHRTELIGGVRIIDSANEAMVLTEKLVLNTQSKQILTREEVKIFSPNSSTTANGLQGNLTDQRWQLLSNVKSIIKP